MEKTAEFGIEAERVFGFWNWVGGRYSIWSAVGALPLSLVFGFKQFSSFLEGARSIDTHFRSTAFADNIPVLMGLLGIFFHSVRDIPARVILPYSQALSRFPAHIQQVDMESNGKQCGRDGQFLSYKTGPFVLGEPGTNGQHSFYQLLHQGREGFCEFIGFAESQEDCLTEQKVSNHLELMSNFFAQPDALAEGKEGEGHKAFRGDRSSFSLLFKKLDSFSCGQLVALYEHRIAVEGFLLGVNSFDQFGVELGKVLAKTMRKDISGEEEGSWNQGTSQLLNKFKAMRK